MHLEQREQNIELGHPRQDRGIGVRVLVRADGTVVTADEWYYLFVQENSKLSICSLISPEDGEALKGCLERYAAERGYWLREEGTLLEEFITTLENRLGNFVAHCHLRLESTKETEDRKALFCLVLTDLIGMREYISMNKEILAKYRFFMTLENRIYFDYFPSSGKISVYKYINGTSFKLANEPLDSYIARVHEPYVEKDPESKQYLRAITSYLKKQETSFEMNARFRDAQGAEAFGWFAGGVPKGVTDLVTGFYVPGQASEEEPYYMTAAGRDPGTGLLNKRAITEYTVDTLKTLPEAQTAWLLIIDVDDFKSINDNFGHAFGDEVIRYVADTLRQEVAMLGSVGRFGGDEFCVFLHRVPTREDLKLLLKVITKQFYIRFDDRFKLTISVGASCFPRDGATFEELFAKADKALYIAKEKGKNRHIIYDPELHGSLEEDSIRTQAVSYAISGEKRRQILGKIMVGICEQGPDYFLKKKKNLADLRTVFDIDGITICTDFGAKVLIRDGKYVAPSDLGRFAAYGADLFRRNENSGTYFENNVLTMRESAPDAYNVLYVQQEIGACIVCAEFVGDTPYALMSFDIFNKTRKWSDRDFDMISLIGQTVTHLLAEQDME